jgi:hypothetical protein
VVLTLVLLFGIAILTLAHIANVPASSPYRAGWLADSTTGSRDHLRVAQLFRRSTSVTKAMYEAIQTGMTYAEVVRIIGRSGEEMSRVELGGHVTVMYMWQNGDGGNMNVMIQNGQVVSKAQFGLR